MDEVMIQAYEDEDFEELSSRLREISIDQIRDLVDDHILRQKCTREPVFILRAIFKGCSIERNHLSSHALAAFTHSLKLLTSPDVSQKTGTDMFGVLLQEVDQLSTGGLVDTTKMIIEMIKSGNMGHGRAIEVLPKVLSCLEQKREVHLGLGQGSMPGREYKKHLVNTLCSGKWSGKSFIHLATVFKDVAMSSDEMGFFLGKMLRQLEQLDVHEIPPLVYQLLTFTCEAQHGTLLRGVFTAFAKLDNRSLGETKKANADGEFWDEMFEIEGNSDSECTDGSAFSKDLRAVEGTILLHLTNKAKSDRSLSKAFLKMLKLAKDAISGNSISNLSLAFALCLAQTENFREQVLEQLRTIIFRSFLHRHKEIRSNWLRQRSISVPDIRKTLLDVLESSKHGWDEVVAGAVYLGFCLMDTYGPKGGAFGRPLEGEPAREDTPQRACCDLGATLLANAFKSHPAVRTEVVEQIMNRAVTKTSSPIMHFTDVLKGISKRYPSTLLSSKHKLREFFNCIGLLSPQNADIVLRSVLPLVRISADLKDSLILVLRKALCSCQVNGHVIACNGFLLLLRCFKVNGSFVSLSQAASQSSQSLFSTCSQMSGSSLSQTSNHEPLCMEVLSTLRRCLNQQATVRGTLYQGLWDVVANNPCLTEPIVEKLLKHFRLYYDAHEGIIPPIKTEKCVGVQSKEPALIEPLPLLMSSIFLFSNKGKESRTDEAVDEEDDDALNPGLLASIHEMFESITSRMVKSEMDDYELDKAAEFSNSTSVGKKNTILANLVIGCYQAVIEYNFLHGDMSEETASTILRLHSCSKKIREAVGKTSSANGFHASPVFVKNVVKGLFCDASPDREVGMSTLRDNDDFVKYAVEIAQAAVVCARDQGTMKGIGGQDKALVRDTCMTVGTACLRGFALVQGDPTTSAVGHSCLEVFHTALQYVATRKRKRMDEFLASSAASLVDVGSTKDINARDQCVRRFQRIVISYLSEDVALSAAHKKIAPLLVSVLDFLSTRYSVESEGGAIEGGPRHSSTPYPAGITQMNEWTGKLCSQQVIDDNAITKALISLHLKLSIACGPWMGTERTAQGSEGAIRDTAKDIHIVAGNAEPEEEEESRVDEERRRGSHYPIIDECNVIALVPLLVSHIDVSVEETDWVLQRVRGQVVSLLAEEKFKDLQDEAEVQFVSDFHEKRRKTESAMCTRLGNLLVACRELIQSALPLGPPTESVLRGLTKVFTLLTSFTKYHTWLVAQGVSKAPSPRFEKLIKLTGMEVTRHVYPFINHIEGLQSSREAPAAKKRKRNGETDPAATNLKKQKVLRETKSIPPLVYAVENLERFLITLGKRCKIDLLSGHKLPTSRDFRIKSAIIKEKALAARDAESQEEVQQRSDDEARSGVTMNGVMNCD